MINISNNQAFAINKSCIFVKRDISVMLKNQNNLNMTMVSCRFNK